MKKLSLFGLLLLVCVGMSAASYGILINDKTYFAGTKNGNPMDPSFEEYQALGVPVQAGDELQLYDKENAAGWAVDLDTWSVTGFSLNGDHYTCTVSGCYDFYIKLKWQADQLYIGASQGDCSSNKGENIGGDDPTPPVDPVDPVDPIDPVDPGTASTVYFINTRNWRGAITFVNYSSADASQKTEVEMTAAGDIWIPRHRTEAPDGSVAVEEGSLGKYNYFSAQSSTSYDKCSFIGGTNTAIKIEGLDYQANSYYAPRTNAWYSAAYPILLGENVVLTNCSGTFTSGSLVVTGTAMDLKAKLAEDDKVESWYYDAAFTNAIPDSKGKSEITLVVSEEHTGAFVNTGMETGLKDASAADTKVRKWMENNVLLIQRGEHIYTITGQMVR